MVTRLLKILHEVQLYGTSEKLLDVKRGIQKVRETMIPSSKYPGEGEEMLQRQDCFLFNPVGVFKKIWTSVLILMLIYTATIMPYKLALIQDDSVYLVWQNFDTFIDMFFICDILVNFNSPLEVTQQVYSKNRKTIMLSYLKSWFVIDLLSSIPMNLISMNLVTTSSQRLKNQGLIRLLRLPKLYRLLRMTRLIRIFKVITKSNAFSKILHFFKLNQGAMRFLTFFITMMTSVHVIGCLWILVASM